MPRPPDEQEPEGGPEGPPAPGPEPGEGGGREVEALHRALAREPVEPSEGREPAPIWLWVVVALALFGGGYYLGRHGGRLDTTAHIGYVPVGGAVPGGARVGGGAAPGGAPGGGGAAPGGGGAGAPPSGEAVYTTRCVACHQADAHGLPGVFPPLVGSEWVAGDPTVMIKIVLGGLSGKVTVAGADYDGAMPAWRDQLDDAAIAAVITHERTLAGVQGPPIDAAAVAAVRAATAGRAGPWTEAELGAP